MIQIKNASKTFHASGNNKTTALNGIDLVVENGDYVVLLGSNGSGKSTLLNSIAGSFLLDAGSIFIDGLDVTNLQEYKRSKYIARIFQNPLHGTASELSIEENLMLASLRTKTKNLSIGLDTQFKNLVKEKVATLGLGLENKTSQPIGLLSGGQRQALTLLMATMNETKVLLMDEPIAALDPRSAEVVMETANQIIQQNQITTLLVTHRIKDAIDFGNRIIFMKEGKIEKDISSNAKSKLTIADIAAWF